MTMREKLLESIRTRGWMKYNAGESSSHRSSGGAVCILGHIRLVTEGVPGYPTSKKGEKVIAQLAATARKFFPGIAVGYYEKMSDMRLLESLNDGPDGKKKIIRIIEATDFDA